MLDNITTRVVFKAGLFCQTVFWMASVIGDLGDGFYLKRQGAAVCEQLLATDVVFSLALRDVGNGAWPVDQPAVVIVWCIIGENCCLKFAKAGRLDVGIAGGSFFHLYDT